mgnify:FL=1
MKCRIGGNAPQWCEHMGNELEGLLFYGSFQHPYQLETQVSVFFNGDPDELLQRRIYPDCAVRVFTHEPSAEGSDTRFTCDYLNLTSIESGDEDGLIIMGQPEMIQEEEYYTDALDRDGWEFLMQIDEAGYPDDLATTYPFFYGALYLYWKPESGEVTAGYWQCS